ncbi:MAG: leucyl aminopeptidase family protein [Actinobacteria bacterium]|nr:leucyl aminopeptidase family protein [Actinomycetota bacterium]MBI3687976.1 leucyl aminopeptidase family protein [Actinomycetota bacterium]
MAGRCPAADALAVPVTPSGADGAQAGPGAEWIPLDVATLLAESGSSGEAGRVTSVPLPGHRPALAYLVGVGASTPADYRAAGAAMVRATGDRLEHGVRHLAATVGHGTDPAGLRVLVEAACLASYRYSVRAQRPAELARLTFVVDDPDRYQDALARGLAAARATCTARDLINTPSLAKSPAWLAGRATRWLSRLGVTVTVRAERELADEGFGGILAVGGGSSRGPRLIEAGWAPSGARGPHVVLVGKGITFDTGGLSIKPADGMNQMNTDMAGGAVVLGAVAAVAELGLPVRVTALVPAAENAVSGASYRPGDVIRHFGGRTTEVVNTDAEGRLVLADALSYAATRLDPDHLVDVATLTGAVRVALGVRTAALFSTDDALADDLLRAAGVAGEELWRMPLPAEYEPLVESEIADGNNAAGNPGAVTAALFLKPFAAGRSWAHLDVAGAGRASADSGVLSRGGTGYGVRTLLRWLEELAG